MQKSKTVISFDGRKKEFILSVVDKNSNISYQHGLVDSFNFIEKLFTKAKTTNEYGYILALLRIKANESPGWDTFNTVRSLYDSYVSGRESIQFIKDLLPYLSLYTYGIIVEARAVYETIANMLNAIESKPYSFQNYNEDTVPGDIIKNIQKRSEKVGIDGSFFNEFYNNKLRNAVFHSDFTLSSRYLRIPSNKIEFTDQEVLVLINRCYSYLEAFFRLFDEHRQSYKKSEIFDLKTPNNITSFRTIIKKEVGIVAIKGEYTEEEIIKGVKQMQAGRYSLREKELIKLGVYELPISIEDKFNNIIQKFPRRLRPSLVKVCKKIIDKYF